MFEEEFSHFNNVLTEENHSENEQQPNNEQSTNDEWISIWIGFWLIKDSNIQSAKDIHLFSILSI